MKKTIATLIASSALLASLPAAEQKAHEAGFVNFSSCRTDSKIGKHEQESMEKALTSMRELIQDRENALKGLQEKFQDADYMDGLNPAAAEEMKGQFQALQEEYSRYQQQYMQVGQQAQMRMMQTIHDHSKTAAEKIARVKGLDYIIPMESVLYCSSNLDLTSEVISEMDKEFDALNLKAAAK